MKVWPYPIDVADVVPDNDDDVEEISITDLIARRPGGGESE